MSTDLRDRLQALAGDAQVARTDPAQLWRRGRTWQRRRAWGVSLVTAATLTILAGLVGVATQRASAPTPPASADAQAVLPDQIFAPSRWLPGTGDKGPLGQLVALIEAQRGSWTGQRRAVVGISAATGEYRFLDLPDAAWDEFSPVALSPDGRRVAYWLAGEPQGTPNTVVVPSGPVVGVGVYDSVTGEVRREVIPTEHGLWPDRLLWTDERTLVLGYHQTNAGNDGPEEDRYSGRDAPPRVWDVTLDASKELELTRDLSGRTIGRASNGRLLIGATDARDFWVVDIHDVEAARRFQLQRLASMGDPVLDPSGRLLVDLPAARTPNQLTIAELSPAGAAEPAEVAVEPVPRSGGTCRVLGWADSTHVTVIRSTRDGRRDDAAIFELDISTGDARMQVTLPYDSGTGLDHGSGLHVATDLLGAPVVEATEPQRPWDPRGTAALVAVVLALAMAAGRAWMRRVRP
jgi:hypothetical protein